ncbi:MAG: OB-fold domain-containing protein, partial [Bacteroidota bacterium]
MYDYFHGQVAALSPTTVTIDCAGVGFFLHISLHTYSRIKDQQKVKLYAHHVVREDAQL